MYRYANGRLLRSGPGVAADFFALAVGYASPEAVADPPSLVVTMPDPSRVTAGSVVVLTGKVRPGLADGPVPQVTVNGRSVDATDAAGNFFSRRTIAQGSNTFTVRAADSTGTQTYAVSYGSLGAIHGLTWLEVDGDGIRDQLADFGSQIYLGPPGDPIPGLSPNDDASSTDKVPLGFTLN